MYNFDPPDYPEFISDEIIFVTNIHLPSLNGFQVRNGMYGDVSSPDPSDGHVHLAFDTDIVPSPVESHIEWIIENQVNLHNIVINALSAVYPDARKEIYDDFVDPKDAAILLPELTKNDDIKKISGIAAIYLSGKEKDSMPYFGIEFGCTWEEEHGVGIMFHGTKILELGYADISFDSGIPERDFEK